MTTSRRDEFIAELIAQAKTDENFVVLDADVGNATRTWDFGQAYPKRFYELGIAEQNMLGVAGGLASSGLKVFACTFATFITMRAFEMARTAIAYPGLDVVMIGGYAGLSNGKDGATHQSVEDLALMRAVPGMAVLVAADAMASKKFAPLLLGHHGPVYLRMEYDEPANIYTEDAAFKVGGLNVVWQGGDITLAACGSCVSEALKAAEALEKEGVGAEVLDVYSLKPFDEAAFAKSAQKTGRVITVEDHNVIGGLAGAVCEAMCKNGMAANYAALGIQDCFTESGKTTELRAKYGTNSAAILAAARKMLEG